MPQKISNGTPAPVLLSEALKYPDGTEWEWNNDEKLLKFQQEGVIEWKFHVQCTLPADVNPITLTM